MTDDAKDEAAKAKEQAAQAGHQAKAAAKSTGRAVRDAAEPVVEEATEKVEDIAEDAVSFGRRLGYAGPELAISAVCLGLAIVSGKRAYTKIQAHPG